MAQTVDGWTERIDLTSGDRHNILKEYMYSQFRAFSVALDSLFNTGSGHLSLSLLLADASLAKCAF